jgi:hypothetical protein
MRREVGHLQSEREFFHRLDVELIEKMRKRAQVEQQRVRMTEISRSRCEELERQRPQISQAAGTGDPEIVTALQNLGYTPATISLLHLIPVIRVAWIDGSVTRSERRVVLGLASLHGVERNTPAYNQLTAWLDRRPHETLLQGSWHALLALSRTIAPDERRAARDRLLQECRAVASASGGILNRICAAERGLLQQMEADSDLQPQAAAQATNTGR